MSENTVSQIQMKPTKWSRISNVYQNNSGRKSIKATKECRKSIKARNGPRNVSMYIVIKRVLKMFNISSAMLKKLLLLVFQRPKA